MNGPVAPQGSWQIVEPQVSMSHSKAEVHHSHPFPAVPRVDLYSQCVLVSSDSS